MEAKNNTCGVLTEKCNFKGKCHSLCQNSPNLSNLNDLKSIYVPENK